MQQSFDDLLRRLDHLSTQFHELREGIRQAVTIAELDPEMSLTRARKVLEYVLRQIYESRIHEQAGTRPLENLIQRLTKDGHLPRRLAAYANTVRELGNVGTHTFGEQITPKDVLQSLTQLLQIVEWYFEQMEPQGSLEKIPTDLELAQGLETRVVTKCSNNIPFELTPLIGRESEVATVERLLNQKEVRLLTVTGPGGIGKTRLSLQVAANMIDHFEDGVFLIALGAVEDSDLVGSAIAQTLEIREVGGQSLFDTMIEYIGHKKMLLLLDNFEQIISAAPVIARLLSACPWLKVLVTSRAPLHLRGEHQFLIPPLSLPNPKRLPPTDSLSQYAAVALFIQRAVAINPEFAVTNDNAPAVAEICARLDGLPLAIELAAARIKLLSPQAMLIRLENRLNVLTGGARDLPVRQQTMRGAIAWSYDLLDENEQELFRRLAVFSGGFSLDAVEAVCNLTSDLGLDVLDGVASLVDKNFLRQEQLRGGEVRFLMLETIREYGLECLKMSGESDAAHQQHSSYFLSLSEKAKPHLSSATQQVWLERLDDNIENLRAALRWMLDHRKAEEGMHMAAALWWFWHIRGYLSEGRGWLNGFIAMAEGNNVSSRVRARALNAAGGLATDQGDYEGAVKLYVDSLEIARQMGDKKRVAITLNNLGTIAQARGDYEQSIAFFEESLSLTRELGDKHSTVILLLNLGILAGIQRDYERAESLFDQSLPVIQELDNKWLLGALLNSRGDLAQYRGNFERASVLYKESLTIRQMLGDKIGIASCLEGLAGVAYSQAQLERCARLLGAAQLICETIGASLRFTTSTAHDYSLAAVCSKLGNIEFKAMWQQGRVMTFEQSVAYALEEPKSKSLE